MRIRKQASKLLGWAYHSQFPSSHSPPPSEADAGELQCQHNLSPWDAINNPHCTISQEDLEVANEMSDIGVIGNGFQAKEKEEVEEDDEEDKEELDDKAEDKETEATGVMQCKKTNGKRWHCRRPAKLPHSLCSYHLTQLRSYRARFEDQVSGDHRKKPSFALDCARATSNYYYYYSVLGPWWGKRRGPINGDEGGKTGLNEDSESESSPQDSNGKTDREGVEEADEKEDGAVSFSEVKYNNNKKTKKKRVIKNRGRKPVKYRGKIFKISMFKTLISGLGTLKKI